MNKNTIPNNRQLLQLVLRAQHLARKEARTDEGYAMMLVSIVTILLFSLLGAFLTMTNLNVSSTAAYTKSAGTFYAAESGLNARAIQIRQKVGSYDLPTGTSPTSITQCLNAAPTAAIQYVQPVGVNDFGCLNFNFDSKTGTASDRVTGSAYNVTLTQRQTPDTFIATTYIVDNPNNQAPYPVQANIPAGDLFAGMNMLQYTHRVFSTAQAANNSAPERTVLQLDFQTRFVPLFQFAAFYNNDLEIHPGQPMTLNGRVHTNGSLYLNSAAGLCITGQVSARENIYNRFKDSRGGGSNVFLYNDPTQCQNGVVTVNPLNRLQNATTAATTAANINTSVAGNSDSTDRVNMNARFGNNVVDRVNQITTPNPDFLARTNAAGALSTYYTKADLRIQAKSNPGATTNIPFNVTSIAQGMGSGACAGFDVASDKVDLTTVRCMSFAAGQLHSLRQPVLVRTNPITTPDDNRLCVAELGLVTAPTGIPAATTAAITALTPAQKDTLVRALQTAIVSQRGVIDYSTIGYIPATATTLSNASLADVRALFQTYLTSAGITTVTAANLGNFNLAQIAAIAGDCFKPAPIQTYQTFRNNREARTIAMLQTNIESLTIWNRDGLYVDLIVDGAGNPQLAAGQYQVANHVNGQGLSANQELFQRAPIPARLTTCGVTDTLCQDSFLHLGLASADTNEGGLVIHMTVDANNRVGTTTAYPAGQSPYGFAITGGGQLPGPLTIATDQAAYVQGDYNFHAGTANPATPAGTTYLSSIDGGTTNSIANGLTRNPINNAIWTRAGLSNYPVISGGYKYPSSILADSINVLSRGGCIDTNFRLDCGIAGAAGGGVLPTTINAAFLGGTELTPSVGSTTYSGGLENYPRFHETWSGVNNLTYRGSFISLGTPLNVSGTWGAQRYAAPGRNWNYDTDFNNVANLPPLTPNIVYLRQQVFTRSYGNN